MTKYAATARKTPKSLQVDVHSGGAHYTIDEPKNSGGSNTGMNPVELELSTLGASLQATAAKLAKEKKLVYGNFTVNLAGDLDPRGFMGDPKIRNGFQQIRLNYQIQTSASEDEVKAFIKEVEAQSSVYQALKNGTKVIVDSVTTK